jgi:hypothetical protein
LRGTEIRLKRFIIPLTISLQLSVLLDTRPLGPVPIRSKHIGS